MLVRRAILWLVVALRWSLIAAMAVMVACVAYQVLMRYVFSRAPSWTEELAVLMFSWAILGALALGVREGFHVGLTMLLDTLGAVGRARAERAIAVLTAALGAYLTWSGWRFLDATLGTKSAAIGYPIEVLHVMALIAGILVLVFALERVIWGPSDVGAAA
jgi:TRAP-type C4-dicarboxylate transport system permease small subunit